MLVSFVIELNYLEIVKGHLGPLGAVNRKSCSYIPVYLLWFTLL